VLTRSASPSVSGCRLEGMPSRVPKRLQSDCQKLLTNCGSRSLTNTCDSPCNRQTPRKKQCPLLLRSMCTAKKKGHSRHVVDHNQHIAETIALWLVCQVVKPHSVPRSRWNMQRLKSRSHLLNLSSSTHDAALTKNISHLGQLVSTRTCRAL
jgi:hypothetical protein